MKRNDSENKPTVPALDEMHQAKVDLPYQNHHGLCFVVDAEGTIKYVDNIYKGTHISYPYSKSFYDLIVPDSQSSAKAMIDSVFSGMPISSFTAKMFILGEKVQKLSIIASPRSAEKEIKLVALICHETSETKTVIDSDPTIKQQIRKLQCQNEELQRKNSFLDSFVTGAAHDLRSPLVLLKTYPDLIRRFKEEKKKIAALDMMKEATVRMETMLNNMMELVDFQKNDQHKKEVLQFEKVFKSIFYQLSFEIKGTNPIFVTNFEQAPEINYYKAHLNSIIYNLVSNSIKYRKDNEVLKIEITTQQEGPYLLLKIADNGIGMDLIKFRHLLFQPFKRLNTTQKGCGLGLSMIKNNIEINGGKIEVESKEGLGSCFYVYLKQ